MVGFVSVQITFCKTVFRERNQSKAFCYPYNKCLRVYYYILRSYRPRIGYLCGVHENKAFGAPERWPRIYSGPELAVAQTRSEAQFIVMRAQRVAALALQKQICLCGTTHNLPTHKSDALARAWYLMGGARQRANQE